MLGAAAQKIDSIPAWKSVKYPSVVKNIMQIPDDKQLIMGIALGYRNQATKINVFYTERSEVDKFLIIETIQRGPTTMPMVGPLWIISCSLV